MSTRGESVMAPNSMIVLGKIFRPTTVACLTLLFSPLVADSQDEVILTDEEDAQSLLVRVANIYTDLEQFYFEALEVTETLSKGSKRKSQVDYVAAADADGRARFSESTDVYERVAVFDGSAHWIYAPLLKQYTRHRNASFLANRSELANSKIFDVRKRALRYVRRYSAVATRLREARFVTEGLQPANSQVTVEAVYDTPAGVPQGEIRRKYRIASRVGLVMHELSLASIRKLDTDYPVQVRQVTTFFSASIGNDIPVETFVFEPPIDAELVERFGTVPGLVSRLKNQPAPEFSLQDFSGKTYRLQELAGKVVLLDFWATWCKPCRIDLPHVEALSREFTDQGLVVLAVNTEPASRSGAFFNQHGYNFPSLIDWESRVSQQYFVSSLPTVVIIDREGRISSYLVGLHPEERLRSELRKVGIR